MCTAYRAYLSRYRETSALYAFTLPCNTRATSAASELSIPVGPCIYTCRHSRGRVCAALRYACASIAAISHKALRLSERISPRCIEALLTSRVPLQHLGWGEAPRETFV